MPPAEEAPIVRLPIAPGPVAANNGNKIAWFHFEADVFKRLLFIHCTGKKRFTDTFYPQHLYPRLSAVPLAFDKRQGQRHCD